MEPHRSRIIFFKHIPIVASFSMLVIYAQQYLHRL